MTTHVEDEAKSINGITGPEGDTANDATADVLHGWIDAHTYTSSTLHVCRRDPAGPAENQTYIHDAASKVTYIKCIRGSIYNSMMENSSDCFFKYGSSSTRNNDMAAVQEIMRSR